MSNRACEFLDRWKLEHIGNVPKERKLQEIVRLVAKCRIDAMSAGIPPEELREAAGGGLFRDMIAALPMVKENETRAEGSTNQAANKTRQTVWQRLVSQVSPAIGA